MKKLVKEKITAEEKETKIGNPTREKKRKASPIRRDKPSVNPPAKALKTLKEGGMTAPAVKPAEPKTKPGVLPERRPTPGRPSPIRRDKPAVTPRPKASAEEVAKKFVAMSKDNPEVKNLLKLLKKKHNK